MDRPDLHDIRDSQVFRSYYYLLTELKAYCKDNGLPTSGGKQEINNRIAHYIDTGEILRPSAKHVQTNRTEAVTIDSVIEPNIKCSELHREFFRETIGKRFTFKVAFQVWLRENAGKTYREAIEAYYVIMEDGSPTVISKQFEYNTYIRAIHADNPGLKHKDAITCWNYKKSQPGHNRYECSDLVALKQSLGESN